MTLANEAAILVPNDPQSPVAIFAEILAGIARVKHYQPKAPRPSQPGVAKSPPHKWCAGRRKKLANA